MATTAFKATASLPTSRFFCGIDVHKQEVTVAIFSHDDIHAEFLKTNAFPATKAGLDAFWQFASRYNPQGFAMEATGVYHHTVSLFLEQKRSGLNDNFEILIVNPADAKGIPGKQKCDRLDARDLARYYAAGLLKGGKLIVVAFEDLKALFRAESHLEKDRTMLKNRIKKTLDRAGFRVPSLELNHDWVNAVLFALTHHEGTVQEFLTAAFDCDSPLLKYRTYLSKALPDWEPYREISLTSAQKALVRQELYDLDLKTVRQTLLKLEIEKIVKDRLAVRDLAHRLASIPGISIHSAVWLIAEVGGIRRFHNRRQFLSYCGCVPRANTSAKKVYSAHISRHSNKYIRTIFFHAARSVCTTVKRDSGLKRYADRMAARKGREPVLVWCTVGAKIARIVYAMMAQNSQFMPNLAQNKHLLAEIASNKTMSLLEQKDLRRARVALQRIQAFKRLHVVSSELETLIVALEEILAKK